MSNEDTKELSNEDLESQMLVYGLYDPNTHECRYIGLSTVGVTRPKAHKYDVERPNATNDYKKAWLKKLAEEGKTYYYRVLEFVHKEEELGKCEKKWIAFGRENGWPLVNLTEGGDSRKGAIGDEHLREIEALTDAQIIKVYAALLKGHPKTEISKALGISLPVVTRIKYYRIRPSLMEATFGKYKILNTGKYLEIAPDVHRKISSGERLSDIAREYGISPSIVLLIKRHKIYTEDLDAMFGPYVPVKERGWLEDYAVEIYREILKGRDYQEIADQFGTSYQSVFDIRRHGRYKDIIEAEFGPIPMPPKDRHKPKPPEPPKRPRNKYREVACDIYREILKGRLLTEIAEQFGCKVSMVEDIKGYRVYPDVLEAEFGPYKKLPKVKQQNKPKPYVHWNSRVVLPVAIELVNDTNPAASSPPTNKDD